MAYILELHDICKHFGNVLANDHINLNVEKELSTALLVKMELEKTTLMNILYGLYMQDSGEIQVNGQKVKIDSPSDAIGLGIGMIHQHFKLISAMTVAEKCDAGRRTDKGKLFLI